MRSTVWSVSLFLLAGTACSVVAPTPKMTSSVSPASVTPRLESTATAVPTAEPSPPPAAVETDHDDNLAMFTATGIRIVTFTNGEPTSAQSIPMPEGIVDNSRDQLSWSPDGSQLAYSATVSETFDDRIFVVDLANGSQIDVGRGRGLAWAPDGQSLVTVVEAKSVERVDLTSGSETILTDASLFWSNPFFLPGYSDHVFAAGMAIPNMSGRLDGEFAVYAIPLNGSQQVDPTVWSLKGYGRLPTDIQVSPDGRWLLYTGQNPVDPHMVMLSHHTVSVAGRSGSRYQPFPAIVPTEFANATVIYNGLQYGWLPDSSAYLALRLFTYEVGRSDDPNYAISGDHDHCVLDVVSPMAQVLRTLPICLIEPAVNTGMTLLAAPVKVADRSWVVRIYDLDGHPLTDLRWGYDLTFAP